MITALLTVQITLSKTQLHTLSQSDLLYGHQSIEVQVFRLSNAGEIFKPD